MADWDESAEQALVDELAELRRLASGAGMDVPDEGLPDCEPAAEFVARMLRQDARARVRRRSVAVAIAAAVVLVAGFVAVLRPDGGSPAAASVPPLLDFEFAFAAGIEHAPGQNPGPVLAQLASAAASAQVDQGSGTSQYVLSNSWAVNSDEHSAAIIPKVVQTWLRPDGRLDIIERGGKPLSADGRDSVIPNPPGYSAGALAEKGRPGDFDPGFAKGLPRHPKALAAALLAAADCPSKQPGNARSSCLYDQVVRLFQLWVVPSDLASAVWTMLAAEPDFRSLGNVLDRAGRSGVGISFISADRPEYREIMIVSRETGQLAGEETILIKNEASSHVHPPAVTSFLTILQSRRVS